MELVGASWGFIRKPFLQRSFKHGLFSSLIGIMLLALVQVFLIWQLPQSGKYFNEKYILYIVVGMVGGGILLNMSSTYYVVTKFLNMRVKHLYR